MYSGGAKGIDTAAHQGALQAMVVPYVFWDVGIEYPYLMENEAMRRSIAEHGAIISEFPITNLHLKHHFPYPKSYYFRLIRWCTGSGSGRTQWFSDYSRNRLGTES